MKKYQKLTEKQKTIVDFIIINNGSCSNNRDELLKDFIASETLKTIQNNVPYNKHEIAGILGSLVSEGIIYIEKRYDFELGYDEQDLIEIEFNFVKSLPKEDFILYMMTTK
jgi:hypothetical protein